MENTISKKFLEGFFKNRFLFWNGEVGDFFQNVSYIGTQKRFLFWNGTVCDVIT